MNYTDQPGSTEIELSNGLILFNSYQLYKQQAEDARSFLLSLDVSPENEQECKRIVASARKISEQLNQEKIRIKKKVLEPYTDFENKVKEIIAIITEGEDVARDKLKAIDDKRREDKKEEIRAIWDKRCGSFEGGKYLSFDMFLQDRHLNKTVPISEVETEMLKFLLDARNTIRYFEQKPLKDEYIEEYVKCLDALKAIDIVDRRHEAIKAATTEPYLVIKIIGKADTILAKQLLKDINYKVLEEK